MRAIAYIARFIKWLKCKSHKEKCKTSFDPLTCDDLDSAKLAILSFDQNETFSKEISMLKTGNQLVKKSSDVYNLSPMLDPDGILRVGGVD